MSLTDLMSEAKANTELRKRIGAKRFQLYDCFQCMRCTSGCTSMRLLELKPHQVVSVVRLGLVDELLTSGIVWTCTLCLKCTERCPQEATPSDLIVLLRNIAFEREAPVPEGYLKVVDSILDSGFIQAEREVVSREFETYDRGSLGLPPLPKPSEAFRENLLKLLSEGGV